MKKFLIIIFTLLSAVATGQNSFIRASSGAFLMSGNSFLTTEATTPVDPPVTSSVIVADHTVVDLYDDIPQQWIDSVKTMWLSYAGESHTQAVRDGLSALAQIDNKFAVNITESGTPEAQTSNHLRASRATWGDIDNATGWIYGYGEEDWCASGYGPSYALNESAVARTIAGISYCNSNSLTISAFGFGWCYDPGYNLTAIYIRATKEYIDYCSTNSIKTTVFFTTGPIDSDLTQMAASSEEAYDNSRRWQTIRDTVALDETRVLFDYADILSHNDVGILQTQTWDGHTYPVIHADNLGGTATGHIGSVGALRLAKAMWWMLARIAGWDGTIN